MLGVLAVAQAHHIDHVDRDWPAGSLDAKKRSRVNASYRFTRYHNIVFRDLGFDLNRHVGERRTQDVFEGVPHALSVVCRPRRCRVVDEVWTREAFEGRAVPADDDVLVKAAYGRFVRGSSLRSEHESIIQIRLYICLAAEKQTGPTTLALRVALLELQSSW